MIGIILIALIVLFALETSFLKKSVKTKNNRNWLILFTLIFSSIISLFLLANYWETHSSQRTLSEILGSFFVIVFLFIANFGILFISIIIKILETLRFKKKGIIRDKIDIKTRLKLTVFPFLLIIFVLISLCAADYAYYKYKEQQEIKKYNEVKKEEVKKMVTFINDKYDINFKEKDCIDYVEKDYSTRGFLPTTYNIPYIAVFKQNNETITVIDRKGFISDNRQLKDIHYIISDYFTSITGINIEFADLGEYTVNSVLEYDFNKKITHENINKFIDIALKKEDFQLIFYVKDTVIKEDLISDLISKFNYLKSLTDDIEVYFYKSDEELLVKFDDNKVDNEEDKYETTPNNDDYDKFGKYYVDNDFTYFLGTTLLYDLRNHQCKEINGWNFCTY